MIQLSVEGNATIRTASTGSESGTTWTVYPYFQSDPTLQKLSSQDRELINSLRVTNNESQGETDIERQAFAISLLLKNLGELTESRKDLDIVVKGIDDVGRESKLGKLLEEKYDIKDIRPESEQLTESKEFKTS